MSTKEKINQIADNYYKPTPVVMRKIGDTLLLVGTTIAGFSAYTWPPLVTAIAAGLTLLGKIITNFWSK